MATPASSFEPVLLDLSDDDDYYIVTEALSDFATRLEADARDEDERDRYEGRPSSHSAEQNRRMAERARDIRADIERQLDANGNARRTTQP